MDFSELPMLPGWADFEPVLDVLHIWFNVKRPELPPIKKKKNLEKRHFYLEKEQDSVRNMLS